MTDQDTINTHSPFSLVPEEHILNGMSPVWQKRFYQALEIIFSHIHNPDMPEWKQIASQCAISAYHFHRMFSAAFNETPARYISRMRLQMAISDLFENPSLSVTDIAHSNGFSSSQALAKALKREYQCTAREIRALHNGHIEPLQSLLNKLSAPVSESRFTEQQLASDIQFLIIESDGFYLLTEQISPPGLYGVVDWHYRNNRSGQARHTPAGSIPPFFMVMSNDDQELPFSEQLLLAGKQTERDKANTVIPAGTYLSCRVSVAGETGWLCAWNSLYQHMLKTGLEPQEGGVHFEIAHNPVAFEELFTPADLSLYLQLKS